MTPQLIDFGRFMDERGLLVVAEEGRHLPFAPKRIFYLLGTDPKHPRGFHAHREGTVICVVLQGSCVMRLDDGKDSCKVTLQNPATGLLVPPMVWHEMHEMSEDCVFLVMADLLYRESDYIRECSIFYLEVGKTA